MAEYDNNNKGALWQAKERKTEKHPNLTGSATIDGVEYFVSAWTSREGGKKPLVSLSFTKKEQPKKSVPMVISDEDIADLPF